MTGITVSKKDHVYLSLEVDEGVGHELGEFFSFNPPNYQYSPSFTGKKWNPRTRKYDKVPKYWDGKIKLFNRRNNTLYVGLLSHLKAFAKDRDYSLDIQFDESTFEFSQIEGIDFIETLNLPKKINGRPLLVQAEQVKAFVSAIRYRRRLLLYPTGGGKSLIIYLILRYLNLKTLIVVPTTTLVHQLAGDFEDYGYDTPVHKIMQGRSLDTNSPVTISTWQSIYKQPQNFFDQFDVLIGDEAHLFQANSLTTLMKKTQSIPNKVGLTATIQDSNVHKLVLEGLFGEIKQLVDTKSLINRKFLSNLNIQIIVMSHNNNSKLNYKDEIEFIVSNPKRNKFIRNLILSLEGNSLVLFHLVERHGQVLYENIVKHTKRPVFFIHGGVPSEERDKIRKIVDKTDNAIVVASYGTFSTGVNIPNLHNVVFATAFKSKIRNMQSIGRGLRKTSTKDSCTLIDLADNLKYSIEHLKSRIELYNEEGFDYKIYPVTIK